MYFQNYATRNSVTPFFLPFFALCVCVCVWSGKRKIEKKYVRLGNRSEKKLKKKSIRQSEQRQHRARTTRLTNKRRPTMQKRFFGRVGVIFFVAVTTMATVKYVSAAVSVLFFATTFYLAL